MIEQYLPILLALAVAAIFGVVTVMTSKIFGPQQPNKDKLSTYESGMKPVGTTDERISVKYYLVAMLFIIFDIEVIFIYPWAVQFKSLFAQYGVMAFVTMLIFIVELGIVYLYVLKKRGLEWD